MSRRAFVLVLLFCASELSAEVSVESQNVEAFVQPDGDVQINYEFLLVGDGTQKYNFLPLTLPRERQTASLKAFARRDGEWISIPVLPSNDKESENDVLLDVSAWTPQPSHPVRVRFEATMKELAALDAVCSNTAGVLTGFTSFPDPDKSANVQWRIHLPVGTPSAEAIAYRDLGDGKYAPIFPPTKADDTVIEWSSRGQPGYYWIYTMLPARVFSRQLKPDWRYLKDSEPRSLPLEEVEMNVRLEPENIARMDIRYFVQNTHSCLPLKSVTYRLWDRGSASAVMNGQKLKSKATGRRNRSYQFEFPAQIPIGGRAEARITSSLRLKIKRVAEDPKFVTLSLKPDISGAANTQPESRRRIRVSLFPETDIKKVTAGKIPFTGTGTYDGRPYVYWDLREIQEVTVKFPRGPLGRFDGYYDFSRPSDWLAVVREVRAVQFFLAVCAIVILIGRKKNPFRKRFK